MEAEEEKEPQPEEEDSTAAELQTPRSRGWFRDLPPARDPMGAGGSAASAPTDASRPDET